MQKMIEALEQEIKNLKARRDLVVEQAIRRLTHEAASTHLGHNLGNQANEISEYDAKIYQTTMILADLKARIALEGN